MKIKYNTPFKEFLIALEAFSLSSDQLQGCLDQVKEIGLKDDLRYDFNSLSFGKLSMLQNIGDSKSFLTTIFGIILLPDDLVSNDIMTDGSLKGLVNKIKVSQFNKMVMNLRTVDALRFILEVKTDLEKTVKLFESIKYDPDPDEIKAGANRMSNGLHGIADWYALRMGMKDVEEAYLTDWTKIFKALKIESDKNIFQRNLMKVKDAKNKRKR